MSTPRMKEAASVGQLLLDNALDSAPKDPPLLVPEAEADVDLTTGASLADFLVSSEIEDGTVNMSDWDSTLDLFGSDVAEDGALGVITSQHDDTDMAFLSKPMQQGDSEANLVDMQSATTSLLPSSHSNSPNTVNSSDKYDASIAEPSSSKAALRKEGEQALALLPDGNGRKEKRRLRDVNNSRRYRFRRKNEVGALKDEVQLLEQQLQVLRLNRTLLHADSSVAKWEERAIAQRHKRRQAEEINEQLQQALLLQTGFVRNLKSMLAQSTPLTLELNMRNFLHSYTHLRKDPRSLVRDLESISADSKLNRAMQVVLRETEATQASTSPKITFQQLDLGAEGVGKTTIAVYAFNTRDAAKTFRATCDAILSCDAVWPDYSLVKSSLQVIPIPPTKHHVRYGISEHLYQQDATGEQIFSEGRDLSYWRMADSCGVFVWDYVDVDDSHPLRKSTAVKRNTVGAVVVRPEMCTDGVERIVCRNICSDMQVLVNLPELALDVARFALLGDIGGCHGLARCCRLSGNGRKWSFGVTFVIFCVLCLNLKQRISGITRCFYRVNARHLSAKQKFSKSFSK